MHVNGFIYLILHLLGLIGQDGQDAGEQPDPLEGEPYTPPPVDPPADPEYNSRYLWCIDCGHGALTKDKRSPVLPGLQTELPTSGQLIEYEFNRDVTERLIEMLDATGIDYMRTMPDHGQYGNALSERVRNANEYPSDKPKRGVSIHANASPANLPGGWQDNARGVETWHHSRSWRGQEMAYRFQARLRQVYVRFTPAPSRDRGVRYKTEGEFFVLRATNYPNVLTEAPMMNNREDVRLLADPAFRQAWAEAHYDAIMEIEGLSEVNALMATAMEELPQLLQWWLALNALLSILKPSEATLERRAERRMSRDAKRAEKRLQRARDRRYRFLRELRQDLDRGQITKEGFDRELSDYDLHNPLP